MDFITRFAPSPTGPLHLGHAFSALTAAKLAHEKNGRFLLRIDDLDQSRARIKWETQLKDDLAWLGLTWPEPCRRQSENFADYRAAIEELSARGLTYPCSCTRRDITAAASAPQEGAAHFGPDGLIYPGTCRGRPMGTATEQNAIRLDLSKALETLDEPLPSFIETGPLHKGTHALTAAYLKHKIGDPVLARPGQSAAYHLAVVIDDAAQGITDVVRGADLFEATFLQRFLQHLLHLPAPRYHHHRLIRDEAGKRLAKRDDARAIALYRENGMAPEDIITIIKP